MKRPVHRIWSVVSILNSGWQQAKKKRAVQLCKNTGKEAIPEMKSFLQGQRYLSITLLLSKVVGPACLETICSQKSIGQQEAMYSVPCSSTGRWYKGHIEMISCDKKVSLVLQSSSLVHAVNRDTPFGGVECCQLKSCWQSFVFCIHIGGMV